MNSHDDAYDNDQTRQALAQALQPLEALRIPRQELEFDERYLSRGGFGVVRRAMWVRNGGSASFTASEDHRPDDYVAVKELVGRTPTSLPFRLALGFARELSVWCSVKHPNILPCLGFNLDIQQGDAYFVSPYISGGNIGDRLDADPVPSAELRMQWVAELTEGLLYLHTFQDGDRATPIVHGDLKPANILIGHKNQAIICDFGLSSIVKEEGSAGLLTSAGFKGTIRWCSPEVIDGQSRTTYSDVWAWALCVLEIITGHPPFYLHRDGPALIQRIYKGSPPSRKEYPELPETSPIWNILESCLKKKPISRATVQESWRRIGLLREQDHTIFPDGHGDLHRHPGRTDRLATSSNPSRRTPEWINKSLNRITRSSSSAGGNVLSVSLPPRRLFGLNRDTPSDVPLSQKSTWAPIGTDDSKSHLIVAMDLGMTFSGVSYACGPPQANGNAPYTEPKVRDVMFEGQENGLGDTKVPTVLFRDEARDVWYCGAETLALTEEDKSKLLKFEEFKLQLLSNELDETARNLLPNVTPALLFSVFFGYMHKCLKAQFEATEFKGPEVWRRIEKDAVYVITHPNNWSSWHQDLLRNALINARIISNGDNGRVTFLTEGEAGLHWWLKEEAQPLSAGDQIVICDAGAGAIDVASYVVSQAEPLEMKESKPSETRNLGACFVTHAFHEHIKEQLRHSKYGRHDTIDRMSRRFETNGKRFFSVNAKANQQIEFGYSDDHDEQYGIRAGILSIPADLVKRLFEPSCTAAVEAIRNHATPNCDVILVGGFAGSPWLYHCVSTGLSDVTPNVKRVGSQPGKAVARGAVEFCLNRRVITRLAKRTLGLPLDIPYDTRTPSHINRQSSLKVDPVSQLRLLSGRLYPLVAKGDVLLDGSTIRVPRTEYVASNRTPYKVVFELVEYVGDLRDVEFIDMDEASTFPSLGQFQARIPPAAFRRVGSDLDGGKEYWEVKYDIAFAMGQTEIRCRVEWVEKGETKGVPAVARWKKH